MLIDLHCHTAGRSYDSSLSPDELVERAKAAGLDGVCVTEHDLFWEYDDVRSLGHRHDFLVIPGCEVNTEEGHMLVFGLSRYTFGMHRAAFLKQEVDRAAGVMLVTHPYRRRFVQGDAPWVPAYELQVQQAAASETLQLAAALEALNGRGSGPQNQFSQDVCQRLAMPGFGASDAHDAAGVGTCATEFGRPIDGLDSLIGAVRAGDFRPVALRERRQAS